MDKAQLIALAKQIAAEFNLDPALVCAVIEQESSWNTFAIRFEPAFLSKYVAPLYTAGKISATEAYSRSFSWGLMQVMGQTARENGFKETFLSQLSEAEFGIRAGCWQLKNILNRVGPGADANQVALQHYNGGGDPNYAAEVLARVDTYNA